MSRIWPWVLVAAFTAGWWLLTRSVALAAVVFFAGAGSARAPGAGAVRRTLEVLAAAATWAGLLHLMLRVEWSYRMP